MICFLTLTNNAIVPCLRKSPHLIAEFHWSVYPCKQVETKLQHTLQMVSRWFYWGIIPEDISSKTAMLI